MQIEYTQWYQLGQFELQGHYFFVLKSIIQLFKRIVTIHLI
jgi:hypothetical protein